MRLTSVWLVRGLFDGRTSVSHHLVADTFEEAARLAPEALQYAWGPPGVSSAPPVTIVSVVLAEEDVRVDG